jgi:sulfur-oxidizing protein SoxY
MNQFFIILFLLTIELSAYANNLRIKVKAVPDGNIVEVKAKIDSQMIDNVTAQRKIIKPEFISHITVRVNNRIVYDVATSGYLNKHPLLKFKYKPYSKNDILEFIVTNNNGKQMKQSFKVDGMGEKEIPISKPEIISLIKDDHLIRPKLWEEVTTKEAIKTLYGSVTPIIGHIKLTVPEVVSNHSAIPIYIQSNEDLESIAIFIDKNPRSAIAVINNPIGGIIDYMLKLNMVITLEDNFYDKPYSITIVGKGRDGKFYKVEDILNVSLCIID